MKETFKLQPTPGRVVIRYVKKPKSSTIIKPGDEEIEDGVGDIVAISERSSQSKVGARVVYNTNASVPVNVDGEEFRVLNEDGILAFFIRD